MGVDSVGIIAIVSMSYTDTYTHSKNIDECGKNPQSVRRKSNYHTKCGKNCHKILSVWRDKILRIWRAMIYSMSYMDFDISHVLQRITYELHYIDGISVAQPLRIRKLNVFFFSSIL